MIIISSQFHLAGLLQEFPHIFVANIGVFVSHMAVETELLHFLGLLPSIVHAPLYDFLRLSSSAHQPVLQNLKTGGIDEQEVAFLEVGVDLLPSLQVDVQEGDLE